MGRVWKRLAGLLPSRPAKPRHVPLGERFAEFRVIGAANDEFLSGLASFQEGLARAPQVGLGAVAGAYESLSAPVGRMAIALVKMAGGRYHSLAQRYEAIDRELAAEVLKERAIEYGPLVAWPADPDALRPQVVGPKAARVAEITASAGQRVPPFFAVTVYGYRLFMEATGLQDLVNEMLWSSDLNDSHSLRSFSEVVTSAISSAEVPRQLAAELLEAYRRLRGGRTGTYGVAVRSSAVVEDAESSFAGQFESVLNVTEDGLIAAYKQVIASKYGLEALRYALARGFLDEDVAMPVLVMAMVQPRAAGVAYSRAPERPDCAMVTAVRGLAQPVVDGRVIPDLYLVGERHPHEVIEAVPGLRGLELRCAADGGVVETREDPTARLEPAISPETAIRIARVAWGLERHFESPQDVEWTVDDDDVVLIVQTRPLHLSATPAAPPVEAPSVEGYRVLVRRATQASAGVAAGRVFRLTDPGALDSVPDGAVLVVPTTSPRLAGVMGTVAAVVAAAGSPTGHMATVAREFGVPCLVGAEGVMGLLADGLLVTVDATEGNVYEGEVIELLLSHARSTPSPGRRDPVRESLQRLLEKVAPLTLTDPDSPEFRPANCTTLHDIARFVHQRAMAEMFAIEGLSAAERRASKRLQWKMPMDLMLLDLGGGLAPFSGRFIPLDYVGSVPLLGLIEGMTDSRLRWSGPVGFDLKGFMSVVVRSAADDQRYGEPSYALCSRDFVHFASRLAYHFATVDAICGESVNENYARFLFHGGAAVAERREYRAHFLATVLSCNHFNVKQTGDRVDAILAKRSAGEIEDALVMLGRLMVASRHLDMVIENRSAAEALAHAFLSGDYGFDRVRRNAS